MNLPSDSELHVIVERVVRQTLRGDSPAPPAAPDPLPALPAAAQPGKGLVALAADHGGYALKQVLKAYLEELGYPTVDCGTHSTDSVDYPDFARAAAELVGQGKAWRAIVVDGAGIGSCIVANKIPGVRAAMCYDHATAVNSREHNDTNVLSLGAGLLGEALARQIILTWLTTPFAGGRHARRVEKINMLDSG